MEGKMGNLGFGTAGLTSIRSYNKCLSLLNCAYGNGITLFDTAPLYGKGYSELILGKFTKDKRSKVTITTKFGLGASNTKFIHPALALPLNYIAKRVMDKKELEKNSSSASPKLYKRSISKIDIEKSLQQSLKNLQTDYIDNFMLHEGLPHFINEDGLDYLFQLKKKGIILNLGVAANSNHLEALESSSLHEWDIIQYNYQSRNRTSKLLSSDFSSKKHYLHSVLRDLEEIKLSEIPENEKAGFLLAKVANENKNSNILFSTRKDSRLIDNINAFYKYKI